jgi:hypothetical protein
MTLSDNLVIGRLATARPTTAAHAAATAHDGSARRRVRADRRAIPGQSLQLQHP